jgi:hypothetical protein
MSELGQTLPTTPERPAMKKTSTRKRRQKENESPSPQLKRISGKLASEGFRRELAAAQKGSAAEALYRRIIE